MLRWQRHHYRIPRHGDHFLRHHRLRALPRVEELASTGRKTQEVRTEPPQPDPPKTGIYHGPNNGVVSRLSLPFPSWFELYITNRPRDLAFLFPTCLLGVCLRTNQLPRIFPFCVNLDSYLRTRR